MHLTEEELENPLGVVQEFFENYHLHEAREDLFNLMRTGLSTDNTTYDTGEKRSNLLFLHEQLVKLTEAAWILSKIKGKTTTNKH